MRLRLTVLCLVAASIAAPRVADAFCGFYVSGADSKLYNNATQVVMMREGRRTVLSMRNNYQGPTEDFAMVVPVPVVLQEDDVKTLPDEVFGRVDRLSAPRLVEYWEQDPCFQPQYDEEDMAYPTAAMVPAEESGGAPPRDLGVKIEAKFDVGEYNIVILSAKDSTGLDTWLKQEKYSIPDGAEPFLRPYVQNGWKFFVAKVDPKKVTFKDGQAMLSPLRFHYDSDEFQLPVRLGLMNSAGKQDLLVYILAQGQRYEVANYPNVTIPTNINVKDAVRTAFGEFYAALFDSTVEKTPKAIVTEYSWDAGSCDPCPEPALDYGELATLGLDVLYKPAGKAKGKAKERAAGAARRRAPSAGAPMPPDAYMPAPPPPTSFVLTRLHARYSADTLGEDLVFKAAKPIAGGREFISNGGKLEEGAVDSGSNNFQGRYAIRHEWKGAIECENPRRGIWGGPPSGAPSSPQAATDLAFVPRGKTVLANVVAQDIPEIGLVAAKGGESPAANKTDTKLPNAANGPKASSKKNGKGCSTGGPSGMPLVLLALGWMILRRRSVGLNR